MRRIARALPWVLVVAVLMVGYVALVPSPSVASAYPTALERYEAPTAWSTGCQFYQRCVGDEVCGPSRCEPSLDPCDGCRVINTNLCVSCYEA